jgi:predicted Zn-dependent protease with MMP-like domain
LPPDCSVSAAPYHAAVRLSEFERIVDEALEELPEWVVQILDNVHVVVEAWPSRHEAPPGEMLLGLYEGVSLLDRGGGYSGVMPDRITVFMGPHLAMGLTGEALRDQIRRTVLHEVAHHLGIDDRRLDELGY